RREWPSFPRSLGSRSAPNTRSVAGCIERACAHLTSPAVLRTYGCLPLRRKAQVAELVDALVSGTTAPRPSGSSPLLATICLDAHEQSRHKEAPRTGWLDSRSHIGVTPRLQASSHQSNDSVTSPEERLGTGACS